MALNKENSAKSVNGAWSTGSASMLTRKKSRFNKGHHCEHCAENHRRGEMVRAHWTEEKRKTERPKVLRSDANKFSVRPMDESGMRKNDSLSQVLITEADKEIVQNVLCKMHALPQLSNMSRGSYCSAHGEGHHCAHCDRAFPECLGNFL